MRGVLVGYVNVHAVDAGDERGQHEHDGNGGEALHYIVEVVANDAGECIHGAAEYVCVYVCHFERLAGIYYNVVEELSFFVGKTKKIGALYFEHHEFVAPQCGYKIHKAFLYSHEVEELFVAIAVVEFLFVEIAFMVDLLEVLHKILYYFLKYFQHHHTALIGVTAFERIKEFFYGAIIERVYRYNMIVR